MHRPLTLPINSVTVISPLSLDLADVDLEWINLIEWLDVLRHLIFIMKHVNISKSDKKIF